MTGIEEAVNRILSKRDRRRMQVHLHEEGPVAEDHGKEYPQDLDGRKALHLIPI